MGGRRPLILCDGVGSGTDFLFPDFLGNTFFVPHFLGEQILLSTDNPDGWGRRQTARTLEVQLFRKFISVLISSWALGLGAGEMGAGLGWGLGARSVRKLVAGPWNSWDPDNE